MFRIILALILLAVVSAAQAQTSAVLPANSVWGNPTGARAQAKPMLLSSPPFAASATTDTTNAANITSGILPIPRLSGSYTGITGVGTLVVGATGAGFTINLGTSTVLGVLPVPNGGTGAATFTANLPLIGNGVSAIAQGTVSGNTTKFATVTGAFTAGDCVSIDGTGNIVAAGGACTVGGGGGTVASSTIGQVPVYTAATTVTGNPALTSAAGALTVGVANTTLGTVTLEGNASGAVTIQPQAAAGSWNFNLPVAAGTAGQVLTSQGGGSTAMTWTSVSGASGTVSAGLINQLAWYAGNGSTVSGLATGNNGTLITSGAGVPSISSTLPAAVQGNITALGTVTAGVWNGTAITGSNIAANTVTNANAAQMTADTIKCNPTGSTANAQDCTVAQTKTLLALNNNIKYAGFDYGADLTGATDSSVAIQNCINGVGATGGICGIEQTGKIRLTSSITLAANVTLQCGMPINIDTPSGWNASTPYGNLGGIRLASTATINLGASAGINGCLIFRDGMTFPANDSSAYAGNAITIANIQSDGSFVTNSLIIGFAKCLTNTAVTSIQRFKMFNVGCDGIAGLDFPPSFDTLDLRDIHLWPYGTVGGAGGDPGLVRSGTGIYVPPGHCDNLVMDVVMVIGYNINFDFECNGNLDLGTLWADYPIAGAGATTIGVKFGNNIDHVTVNNLSSLSSYVGIQTNSGAGSIYISSLHIFGTISDCLQSKGTNIIVAMADITFCGNFGINASAMATSNIISIGSLNLRSITQGVPIAAPSGGTYANFKLGKTFTDLAAGVSLIGSAVQGLVQITSTTNLAPPVDSNIFEVTGANAITNILGTWGGRIIYLKFDAAATIVNSGNVNLTATYTACNGCVLTLLYDQAPNKWQVVSRGTP